MIHHIELPLEPHRTVNAFLVEGRPLTLVDTGLATEESLARLQHEITALGYRIQDLEQIILTHGHLDHFGAARWLAQRSGARVLGDAGSAAAMADFHADWQKAQEYRLSLFRLAGAPPDVGERYWRWGKWYEAQGESVTLDHALTNGAAVTMGAHKWQIVGVPGHSLSAIALYQPDEQWLVSGDILLGNGATNVTLQRLGDGSLPAGWIPEIIATLERLSMLPIATIYPGHGPVITTAGSVARDRIMRIEARLAQVVDLLRSGPHTAYAIAQALYEAPTAASSLGVSQALGYLDALECQGRAAARVEQGVRSYRLTE